MVENITHDTILGKRLKLAQPAKGHRAGTDAILAAAATPAREGHSVVDLGAGVGTIGLAVALRVPHTQVTLTEIDPFLASLAQENIRTNGLSERVGVVCGDVATLGLGGEKGDTGMLLPNGTDHVVANPPFHPQGGRLSPDPRTARARTATEGLLEIWARTAARLLKPCGTFTLIHRPDAVAEIMDALDGRFGAMAIRPVHPFAHEPAVRILVQAIKGSRAPLKILPALVLRDGDGCVTEQMNMLHLEAGSLAME